MALIKETSALPCGNQLISQVLWYRVKVMFPFFCGCCKFIKGTFPWVQLQQGHVTVNELNLYEIGTEIW